MITSSLDPIAPIVHVVMQNAENAGHAKNTLSSIQHHVKKQIPWNAKNIVLANCNTFR